MLFTEDNIYQHWILYYILKIAYQYCYVLCYLWMGASIFMEVEFADLLKISSRWQLIVIQKWSDWFNCILPQRITLHATTDFRKDWKYLFFCRKYYWPFQESGPNIGLFMLIFIFSMVILSMAIKDYESEILENIMTH